MPRHVIDTAAAATPPLARCLRYAAYATPPATLRLFSLLIFACLPAAYLFDADVTMAMLMMPLFFFFFFFFDAYAMPLYALTIAMSQPAVAVVRSLPTRMLSSTFGLMPRADYCLRAVDAAAMHEDAAAYA